MVSTVTRWGGMHFDSSGLVFNSNLMFDTNNHTFIIYLQPENVSLVGNYFVSQQIAFIYGAASVGRCWIPPGLSPSKIGSTVTDGSVWYTTGVEYTPYDTFMFVHTLKDGYMTVMTMKDGTVIKQSSVTAKSIDLAGPTNVWIGCWPGGGRQFQGTVYSALSWNRPLTLNELKELSYLCTCCDEEKIPGRDDLIFGCIFDKVRYGETPVDFVNNVEGVPSDATHPPQWKVELVEDVIG